MENVDFNEEALMEAVAQSGDWSGYPCPSCGFVVTFVDEGMPILVLCPTCRVPVFARTAHGVVHAAGPKMESRTQSQIFDDISISGKPVVLTDEERKTARRLLSW